MSLARSSLRVLQRSRAFSTMKLPGEPNSALSRLGIIPRSLYSACSFLPSANKALPRDFRSIALGRCLSSASRFVDSRQAFHFQASHCRSLEVGGSTSGALDGRSKEELGKTYKVIKAELVGDNSVGLILLNRPEALNALSEALMIEVVDACQTFDGLDEVGAIVITGAGKAFAAGADIKEMKDKSFVEAHKSRIFSHWNSLSLTSKPIIGAINGYALGGGCELALLCDILLAGEKAVFGQPEVNLGVIPGIGGTQRLIREVGKSRAMEMILTGKAFMNAEEAERRGLVSRVVKGGNEALVEEAIALGKSISEHSRPSVAMAKEAVNAAYEVGLQEGIRREHSLFCATFGLEDQKEGMAAFVEKRKPKFQHK